MKRQTKQHSASSPSPDAMEEGGRYGEVAREGWREDKWLQAVASPVFFLLFIA